MSFEYQNEEIPERQITPEEFLRDQKSSIRKKSWWAIGIGSFLILAHLVLFSLVIFSEEFSEMLTWKDLFKSIFFILGLFALVGGIWGLRFAKNLTLKDLIPSQEAILFLQQSRYTKPLYSYFLVGCLVVVTLFQLKTEEVESIFQVGGQSAQVAGLVKPLVWQGGWWRILTSATLHGFFPLHLYFNAQALFRFGSLIEVLSNRAHLAIVFLLSVVGGGILSLFYPTDFPSICASGGIMGLIGYLAIYGYRRKQQLPPDFLKSMLINIGFIAAFGLVAYQIIDNFGHLGGLLVGMIYGFVQVPRDLHKNPRNNSAVTKIFGVIALGIFVATCISSILLLLKII